jgi:hypothetical protein
MKQFETSRELVAHVEEHKANGLLMYWDIFNRQNQAQQVSEVHKEFRGKSIYQIIIIGTLQRSSACVISCLMQSVILFLSCCAGFPVE